MNSELRNQFSEYRGGEEIKQRQRAEAAREVERMMKGFQSAALSRMVESGVFWKHPGKGANLIEGQTQQAMARCGESLAETRRNMETWLSQLDERREVQVQQLLKAPQQDQLVPNQPLQFTLMAHDSNCRPADHRLSLGYHTSLQACAEAVSTECKCGRGFEYDETNGGYCGCGKAGTSNTDCMEDADNFCFGAKRYLLYNPSCSDEPLDRRLDEMNAEKGPLGLPPQKPADLQQAEAEASARVAVSSTGSSGPARKPRQVCFEVYD
uniref:Uncharacterized protein n=1 Tax=Haptolina ericina TaxID=156174 RepID=A0A7S3BJP0_9EUKA